MASTAVLVALVALTVAIASCIAATAWSIDSSAGAGAVCAVEWFDRSAQTALVSALKPAQRCRSMP